MARPKSLASARRRPRTQGEPAATSRPVTEAPGALPEIKIVNLDKTITVGYGANLRKALMFNGISPYQGIWKYANCFGNGHCTKCRVKVLRGDTNDKTLPELYHPLRPRGEDERLACQVSVFGDLEIDTLNDPKFEVVGAGRAEKADGATR